MAQAYSQVFEIEEPETGKIYKVEGVEGTTRAEAIDYLSSLPAQEIAKREIVRPNAMLGPNAEQEVATFAQEEVPEAREYLLDQLFNRKDFNEVRPEFNQRFPGVELPKNMSEIWGQNQALLDSPAGREYLKNNNPINPVNRATGVDDPLAPDSFLEEVGRGMQRGLYGMANTYRKFGALGADLVGADETAADWLDESMKQDAALELNLPSSAPSVYDVDSLEDVGRITASTLGELAPQLAGQFGAGLIGGLIAKRGVKEAAEELVESAAERGISREVAQAEANALVQRVTVRGGVAGAAVPSVAQEQGEAYGTKYARTGEMSPWSSAGVGALAGLLDTLMPANVLRRVGGPIDTDSLAKKVANKAKEVAAQTGQNLTLEGLTEGVQSFLTQLPSGEINIEDIANGIVRGAIGGSVVGGSLGIYESTRNRPAKPSAGPRSVVPEGSAPIPVPTTKGRRTKAYKQEIQQTVESTVDRINELAGNWENAPEFEVHQNFSQLKDVSNNAIGAIREGKVVIHMENAIKEAGRRNVPVDNIINSVVFHEGLGHHGLDLVFGQELDDKLIKILDNSKVYQARVNAWLKKHPDAYAGDPLRDIRALEEIMAEGSENGQLPASFVNVMKNTVKDFGRRMGINMEYSTREVETILGMAHAAVVSGKGRNAASNSFKFMYAGESADTRDLGQLRIAEFMERKGWDVGPDGKSRGQTGWFKGPDGKWRFEISDNKASAHVLNVDDIQSLDDELDGLGDTPSGYLHGWQASSGLEFLKTVHPETTSLTLNQVLDHPELFEAYPELAEIVVFRKFAETQEPGIERNRGSFHPRSKVIYINSKLNEKEALSTLLHEVQHAVQSIEGFAKGGNMDSAILALPPEHLLSTGKNYAQWQKGRLKQKRNEYEAFKFAMNDPDARLMAELDEKVAEYDEYLGTEPEVDDELEAWIREGAVGEREAANLAQFEAESRFLAKLGLTSRQEMTVQEVAELDEIYEFFQTYRDDATRKSYIDDLDAEVIAGKKILEILDEGIKNKDLTTLRTILFSDSNASFQAYESLFGEVEARDVQARQNLGPMAREATTPYTSEPHITPDQYVFDMADDTQSDAGRAATVYHGSPHDFDEFDHSKMGTGEGAQVYGWGTYLTETKDIAEGYKKRLIRQPSDETGPIVRDAIDKYWRTFKSPTVEEAFNRDEVIGYINDFVQWKMQGDLKATPRETMESFYLNDPLNVDPVEGREALAAMNWDHIQTAWDIVEELPLKANRGKLYEVNIPDDAQWLDWDKKQSPEVLEKLNKAGLLNSIQGSYKDDIQYINAEIRDLVDELDELESTAARTWEEEERIADLKIDIEELRSERKELRDKAAGNGTGLTIYKEIVDNLGSPKAASEALQKAGITGTKYLDGFSRKDGEGSYNYVVYDDKTPKVVNKYMMMSSPDKVNYTPEEIADMSPEEIVEHQNAYDLLKNMTNGYTPVVMSMDDLREEAELRGLSTSQVDRLKNFEPGELTKRMFMFDIAMSKLDDQLTKLYGKMMDGTASVTDRTNFLKTEQKRNELAARIWDEQSEIARTLAAMKQITYTRRRINGTLETVAQVAEGSPYEFINDPDEFFKYATSVQSRIDDAKAKMKDSGATWVGNALNLPRALMSTLDLSAPLRQGLFLIHKGAWWRSFANMFRYWGDEKAFKDLEADITSRNTYPLMQAANLALSSADGKLSKREEDFQTEWAQKIPGFGRLVRMSERGYVGFLNKLRADVFDDLVAKLGDNYTEQDLKDLGRFVNAASGRGNLPKVMRGSAPVLNGLLFSPRLIASRVVMTTALVDPRTYTSMNKVARNEYMKSILAVGGTALLILSLAAMGGAEVEEDPRSSDFAKIKVGNTRYDILGGEAQYITLAARLYSNATKTADGDIKKYGTKFGQSTRKDALYKFVENKAAPIPSFVLDYLRGTNAIGEKFEADKAIGERFVPMFIMDMAENISEEGVAKGTSMSLPAFFGVGVQNYKQASLDTERELEGPDFFNMKTAKDGEYPNATVENGVVSLDEKAKKEWTDRINFYYKEWMKDEMADPAWKTMPADEKKEVIKAVRSDARKEAKLDMLEILEIEEEEE